MADGWSGGWEACAGLKSSSSSCSPTTDTRAHHHTTTREEGATLTDELDNQVITDSDNNFISEQRIIGDEFYGDDDVELTEKKSPLSSSEKSPVKNALSPSVADDAEVELPIELCEDTVEVKQRRETFDELLNQELETAAADPDIEPENHVVRKKVEKLDKPDTRASPHNTAADENTTTTTAGDRPADNTNNQTYQIQLIIPPPQPTAIVEASVKNKLDQIDEPIEQVSVRVTSTSVLDRKSAKQEDNNPPAKDSPAKENFVEPEQKVVEVSIKEVDQVQAEQTPSPQLTLEQLAEQELRSADQIDLVQTASKSIVSLTVKGEEEQSPPPPHERLVDITNLARVEADSAGGPVPDKVSEAFDSVLRERFDLPPDNSNLLDSVIIKNGGSVQDTKAVIKTLSLGEVWPKLRGSAKELGPTTEVAVATLESLRDPSGLHQDLFSDGIGNISQEVRVYNGAGDIHQLLSVSQIMTATTQAALESVLESPLVKTEPEDLTGRQRHDTESSLPLDVTTKTMGIVSSPEGESIILSPEDLPLAPGFPSTTLSSYDSPSFPPSYTGTENRIYDSPYREEGLYDGYRAPNSTYFVSGSNPGLSVDLPSPDSGIGPDQITPREIVSESFDYSTQNILEQNTIRRPWHDYGRANSETEKVQIPKVFSPYGFKYYLDAATSSSVRKEDDKVTYINKGQFYGVTLEYIRDPDYQLKSPTVKSIIMLVFREGKSQEEEIKAWQFWHQRQHSVKQRIIDVDTKNSHGLVGHIEELSHNAIAVYWNPMESFAKVNLAVQCLSTDFSTQKGVKGLPLHIQIDTLEDPRQEVGSPAVHRGYCQVKIFCDKGAERKLRDEERRAAKRRMTPSGKRRLDEMYHETFERSDFYSMSDLNKPPTLFTPPEDADKNSQLCQDFPSFYNRPLENKSSVVNGDILPSIHLPVSSPLSTETRTEKTVLVSSPFSEKPKRARLVPPSNERIMIYVRQETEDVYTPLHLVPPTVSGLIASIENKYKINATNIRYIYRKNRDGIVAKIDDDMLRHYCNEDVFLMQVMVTEGPGGEETMVYDITLSEIPAAMEH